MQDTHPNTEATDADANVTVPLPAEPAPQAEIHTARPQLPLLMRVEPVLGALLVLPLAALLLLGLIGIIIIKFFPPDHLPQSDFVTGKSEQIVPAVEPNAKAATPAAEKLAPAVESEINLVGGVCALMAQLALLAAGVIVLRQSWKRLGDGAWKRPPAPPELDWRLYDFIKALAFLLILQFALAQLLAFIAPPDRHMLAFIFAECGTAPYAFYILRCRAARKGLPQPSAFARPGAATLGLAARAYLGFLPPLTALLIASTVIATLLQQTLYGKTEFDLTQNSIQAITDPSLSPAVLALSWLFACAGAPLLEELLFRGILFSGLKRHMHWLAAAALSGIAFGAIHADPYRAIPLAALGMFLAALREHTGSLTVPVLVHALHNTVTLALLAAAM